MDFKAEIKDNTIVVRLNGELDDCAANKIKEKMDYLLYRKDVENIIFDMSKVNFMDSSGVGLLIGRYKQIKQRGGKACLILEDNNIKRILKMSGVLHLFSCSSTEEEAFDSLQNMVLI